MKLKVSCIWIMAVDGWNPPIFPVSKGALSLPLKRWADGQCWNWVALSHAKVPGGQWTNRSDWYILSCYF